MINMTKKIKILAFIIKETDILIVEETHTLFREQLKESVQDWYYRTLHQGDNVEYDGVPLL